MSEINKPSSSQEIEEMFAENNSATETKKSKKSKGPKIVLTTILVLILVAINIPRIKDIKL